jgi:hypothetical protein
MGTTVPKKRYVVHEIQLAERLAYHTGYLVLSPDSLLLQEGTLQRNNLPK